MTDRENGDGEEVERCRQVRRGMERRFGTLNALFEHYKTLDQARRAKGAAKRKQRKTSALPQRSRVVAGP